MALGSTTSMQAADQMQQAVPQQDPNQPIAAPPQSQPMDLASSPQSSQMIEAQAAAPQAPQSGISKMLDFVADMLAGRNQPNQVSFNDQGQRVVTPGAPMSRGQQVATIAARGIRGAATAAAAPPGPGHVGQGVAAAVGQEAALQERQRQQQEQQAQQDFQRQQNAKLQSMNYQLLSRKLISETLNDHLHEQQGTRDQVDFSNKMVDREKAMGSFDLGFVKGAGDIADLGTKDPDLIKDYHDGRIVAWPVYDQEGKNIGLQVFRRKVDVNAQPLPKGEKIVKFTPPHDGKDGYLSSYTPAEGSLSRGEADNLNMLEYNKYQEYLKGKADLALKGAETTKAKAGATESYAQAGKANAERKAIEEATSGDQINTIAQSIYNGTMDPSQLSRRAKSYDAVLTRLQQLNGGQGFDLAKAASDYKYATQKSTQDTLKYMRSLTGENGNGGNLGIVVRMSQDPKLGLTKFPALNNVKQWEQIQTDHPEAAMYRTALLETADQAAKILQGGGTGSGTSDKKLEQASEILNKDFGKASIAGVAVTLQEMLGNRQREMIGDNRYLQRWFSPQPSQPGQPGQPATPRGAAVQPPPINLLQPGHDTTFANGQVWRLVNGQPQQVR